MENKSFGQNRIDICRERSQDQTYGAAGLKMKKREINYLKIEFFAC
jgi:hypothetical protein